MTIWRYRLISAFKPIKALNLLWNSWLLFQKISVQEYITACEWSYCNCEKSNRLECVCQVFAKFVQHYNQIADAMKIDWRDQYNCSKYSLCVLLCKPNDDRLYFAVKVSLSWFMLLSLALKCPVGQVYTSCVPVSQATCTASEVLPSALQKYCEEGCVCAAGTVLHEGKCIQKQDCPCIYNGQFHEPQSVIPKDCNKW